VPAVDPADERRHAPTDDLLWNESHYLDWFSADGSIGGYLRIGLYPNLGRVWYWACLVGRDRSLVTVIDHEVPLPRGAQSLELRAEGIWADHVVETPLDHMTANLEAFAVAVDDPAEVYGDLRGDRVPFGFELDWETDRAAYGWPPVTPRYEIPCRVHGEVLVGDETIEVDGWGQRDHSWGVRDWWERSWCWSAGRLDDGTRWHTTGAVLPGDDWGVAYELAPSSTAFEEHDRIGHDTTTGRDGLVTSERLSFGALDLEVAPVAFSPVGLTHPVDGRVARFPRALCDVTDRSTGRTGHGWVEWNQPPA